METEKKKPAQWIGNVSLSNGKYFRTYAVRVEANTSPQAARRAVGQALFKQKEITVGRKERVTQVKITLQRIKATPKRSDETTA